MLTPLLRSRSLAATLVLCAAALSGCGRVGIDLLPFKGTGPVDSDGGSNGSDAGSRDAGSSDAGVSSDGGDPNACAPDSIDTDVDGVPDCQDLCNGVDDADYTPDRSCGVGYCQAHNTPSSCAAGVETACRPGTALSATDATCDGVDDNCNGSADESYVAINTCGVGACRTRNTPSSCSGGLETACQPGAPLASNDTTLDGVDDDCDGTVDEDACTARTETYGPGTRTLAMGGCRSVTVKLWGGGGASGSGDGGAWINVTGGEGAAGGYVQSTVSVAAGATVELNVGTGGRGCAAAATGTAAYRGGAGGTDNGQAGTNGANGTVTGGTGNSPGAGGKGGNGSYGGGGGGAGSRLYTDYGPGGDGGAATVLLVNGAVSVAAGGGGGGGGAGASFIASGVSGGNGGTGCSGNGAGPAQNPAGGGGGGGVCVGTTRQGGTGRNPYNANNELAAGSAVGGATSADCAVGGNGYAIVVYAP